MIIAEEAIRHAWNISRCCVENYRKYRDEVWCCIMLLGTNNMDIKQLADHGSFIVDVDKRTIKSTKYKMLNLTFMSVHKSKGLEADNVIIINGKNAVLGFPNRISDDPLLQWVLTTPDALEFAEERRLFYVAVTRKELFIVVPENEKLVFVNELIKDYPVLYVLSGVEKPVSSNPKCLTCKTGILVERKASKGNAVLRMHKLSV